MSVSRTQVAVIDVLQLILNFLLSHSATGAAAVLAYAVNVASVVATVIGIAMIVGGLSVNVSKRVCQYHGSSVRK